MYSAARPIEVILHYVQWYGDMEVVVQPINLAARNYHSWQKLFDQYGVLLLEIEIIWQNFSFFFRESKIFCKLPTILSHNFTLIYHTRSFMNSSISTISRYDFAKTSTFIKQQQSFLSTIN